jgi:hypothetical protein
MYERLYEARNDQAELYRRLAYGFDDRWRRNRLPMERLTQAWRLAAVSFLIQIVLLTTLSLDSISA